MLGARLQHKLPQMGPNVEYSFGWVEYSPSQVLTKVWDARPREVGAPIRTSKALTSGSQAPARGGGQQEESGLQPGVGPPHIRGWGSPARPWAEGLRACKEFSGTGRGCLRFGPTNVRMSVEMRLYVNPDLTPHSNDLDEETEVSIVEFPTNFESPPRVTLG